MRLTIHLKILKKSIDEKRRYSTYTISFYRFVRFKNRPALILVSKQSDVVVAFITSNITLVNQLDIVLKPTSETGLKQISALKVSKIATLDKSLVLGKIGQLNTSDILKVNKSISSLFQLNP